MSTKTFDKQTAKFLGVVGENMPEMSGTEMQGWIENPKGLQNVLRDALCPPEARPEFEVWKTIKLGTGIQTADDFRRVLKDGGFRIGNWADDILGKPAFTAAIEEIELDLVKVSVVELGFKDGAKRGDIYNRAQELGLEPCPPEVGPQLRLQYKDQPMDEWLLIGMEPIADSGGALNVFGVGRDSDGLWLRGYFGFPDYFWYGYVHWVFVRPVSVGTQFLGILGFSSLSLGKLKTCLVIQTGLSHFYSLCYDDFGYQINLSMVMAVGDRILGLLRQSGIGYGLYQSSQLISQK